MPPRVPDVEQSPPSAAPTGRAEPPHGIHEVGAAAALLPPCLFAAAVAFFALGLASAPFVVGDLAEHFYQTRVLALTHDLTLGWISMAMIGVLYRYVPAITKRPLPAPRLAVAQAIAYVLGVVGLVMAFSAGRWDAAAAAAAVLALAAVLLCLNLWPLLLRAPRHGVAEVGVLSATAFLVAAATLGTLLALDKGRDLLGGSLVTNLGAHVHLAAVGWVSLTICALSFRFLPAFLLPTVQFPEAARTVVLALAAGVVALVVALLARSPLVAPLAVVVAATLLVYFAILGRVVASHRMPIDWTARHALTGMGWLLATITAGITLALFGTDTALGVHIAAAYGAAGLLGWMSNLLIGISYKLFPGFVAASRAQRRRRKVPVGELGVSERVQPAVFALYNAGLLGLVLALVLDRGALLVPATLVLAAGGLLYAAVMARSLAFAIVDPAPPATALRILD